MADPDATRDPVEELAEEFIERHRRGEQPSVAEYAEAHAALAARIRELFPTLLFLEKAKAESVASPSGGALAEEPARPFETLGDFRILREIGRGGMGVIYEAVQESLGRHVALKVLPASFSSSPRALPRFRREAQAAARLHHTNIVSVFGVGECDGTHFYVMQYIEGCSLDRVLDKLADTRADGRFPDDTLALEEPEEPGEPGSDQAPFDPAVLRAILEGGFGPSASRAASASGRVEPTADSSLPRRATRLTGGPVEPPRQPARQAAPGQRGEEVRVEQPLGSAYWRSVAGIGTQAAAALYYAHHQGTLHRDIKPGNLLLDDQGTVWITDFGLAKLTDQDDLTRPGDVIGTVRYMAPEQWDGKADARTDIYSLGLTLYELLTLRPAFDESNQHRLMRQAAEHTPQRPRKINPAIPRDLETIVLKCITRNPAHRYQTASELAGDLQRFLEDRPIRARRTSAVEHAWRWCRRNPAIAALSAITLALVVMTVVGGSARYVHRTRALHRETRLREQAEAERQRAEANLALAAEAFEDVFNKVGGAPQRQMEQTSDTLWLGSVGLSTVGKKDALVLEGLLRFYDRFAEQNRDSTQWQRESALAYRRVGDIQRRLGRLREAQQAYRRALESNQRLIDRLPGDTRGLVEAAALHNQLGDSMVRTGQLSQAIHQHQLARDILTELGPRESLSENGRFELAESLRGMGFALFLQRQRTPADVPGSAGGLDPETLVGEAVALLSRLAREHPANHRYRFALAVCHMHLWGICRSSECADRAIAIFEKLLAESPDNPEYRHAVARAYAITSHPPFADEPRGPVEPLEKTMISMEQIVATHPDVPDYRHTLAELRLVVAELRFRSGEFEAAESLCQGSIDLFRQPLEDSLGMPMDRLGLMRSLHLMAALQNRRDQPQAARDCLKEAVRVAGSLERLDAPPPPFAGLLAKVYTDLAEALAQLGETAEAERARAMANELEVMATPPPGAESPHEDDAPPRIDPSNGQAEGAEDETAQGATLPADAADRAG